MKQTTIPFKPDSCVSIKCSSDLSIEGTSEGALMVIVEQGETLKMWEENGAVRITAYSDCRVLLPTNAMVTVEKTGGDCYVKNLVGRVVVGKIGHDLKMESVGGTSVESVGRNCHIMDSSGAVEIARVGDTLTADKIQSVLSGSVGNDVRIRQVSGRVDVKAGDEISIQTPEKAVPVIRAIAGSDVALFVPAEANCQLELVSGGREIRVHAGGQQIECSDHELSIPLGNGGETVYLKSGDMVNVSDENNQAWTRESFDWSDQWKDFGVNVARRIEEGFRTAGDSVEYAVRKAGKVSRKAERQVRRVIREWDDWGARPAQTGNVVDVSAVDESTIDVKKRPGPTDEERTIVLRMLQEKKISVEEAEKLLNALER